MSILTLVPPSSPQEDKRDPERLRLATPLANLGRGTHRIASIRKGCVLVPADWISSVTAANICKATTLSERSLPKEKRTIPRGTAQASRALYGYRFGARLAWHAYQRDPWIAAATIAAEIGWKDKTRTSLATTWLSELEEPWKVRQQDRIIGTKDQATWTVPVPREPEELWSMAYVPVPAYAFVDSQLTELDCYDLSVLHMEGEIELHRALRDGEQEEDPREELVPLTWWPLRAPSDAIRATYHVGEAAWSASLLRLEENGYIKLSAGPRRMKMITLAGPKRMI